MVKSIWIIWLWNISNKHILSLKALWIKEIYCYDKNKDKILENISKYNIFWCYTEEDIISKCDVISICTPHDSHLSIIKNVLNNGKICLTEKPLCIYLEELQKLSNIDTTNCYVVFQNRYNNAVKVAKDIISRKELWDIYYIKWFTKWHRDDIYYSLSNWKWKILREWWILYNQWIHNIDTVLWLIWQNNNIENIDILSIIKDKFRNLNIETEDFFSIVLWIWNIKYDYSLVTYWDKWVSENSLLILWTKWALKIWWWALNILEYININWNIEKLYKWEDFDDVYWSWHFKIYDLIINWKFEELPTFIEWINNTKLIESFYATINNEA